MIPRPSRRATLALSLVLVTACAHTTTIRTEPEGASVFVNGVPLGSAPVAWETRSGLPDEAFVKADRPGYLPARDVKVKKSYRADGSLLLLLAGVVPYFFTARYEDDVLIRLEPRGAPPVAVPPGAPPASRPAER